LFVAPDVLARHSGGPPLPAEPFEVAASENLPIDLQPQREHLRFRARIEAGVDRAVGVQATDVRTRDASRRRAGAAAETDEIATDHDLSIRLEQHGVDHAT